MEKKTSQTYSYTGSAEYFLDGIDLSSGSGLGFSLSKSGPGGMGPIPYDGASITVKSGVVGTNPLQKDFSPATNNRVLYLLSNKKYSSSDADEIINLGTEIIMVYDGGSDRYVGTFILSNPDEKSTLYIVWDYTDRTVSGLTAYNGKPSDRYISAPLSADNGRSEVNFDVLSSVARLIIKNGDLTIMDTGFVGVNSTSNYDDLIDLGYDPSEINLEEPLDGLVNNGSITSSFVKDSSISSVVSQVFAPIDPADWTLEVANATTKTFYMSEVYKVSPLETSGETTSATLYHNGIGDLPAAGDVIFADAAGATVFAAENGYLLASTEATRSGTSEEAALSMAVSGAVIANRKSECEEVAIPVISSDDLTFSVNKFSRVVIPVTNNPLYWEVVTDAKNYLVKGGDTGGVFFYVNLAGSRIEESVGSGMSILVFSETDPTVVSGDITIDIQGVCTEAVIPPGMSFNTSSGVIEGVPNETGEYTITLKAVNCFGDSLETDINIASIKYVELKPFKVDASNPEESETLACAVVFSEWNIMFHDGTTDIPTIGVTVFVDSKGTETFTGNSYWYILASGGISARIDSTGKIIDIHTC